MLTFILKQRQNYPALICEASLAREAASLRCVPGHASASANEKECSWSGRPERIPCALCQIHDVEMAVTLSVSCPDANPCGAFDMRGRTG